MGKCHCCPFNLQRKKSADSLSMGTQHPSVDVEMPEKIVTKAKKIDKDHIRILKKQESAYFNKTNRLKLETSELNSKIIPLLTPKGKEKEINAAEEVDHSQLYSKIKEKMKPRIQKISTRDQECSNHNYFSNNQEESEDHEDSFTQDYQTNMRNKTDMTFTGNEEDIVICRQFRTVKEEIKEGSTQKEELEQLLEKLKEDNSTPQKKCEMYYRLGKYECEMRNYSESQQYLQKAIDLLKETQSYELKFDIITLFGYLLLVQQQFSQAAIYHLKAVRMEVNKDGVDSVRLVELYYWLGESYLRLKKLSIAKEYLNKAMRGYKFHDLQDTQLLKMLYLQLGTLYHKEQEFVEADKYYTKGIRIAEQTKIANKYFELLLKKAQNYFAMENYKLCLSAFANTFKALRKYNLTELPIYQQAKSSLIESLKVVSTACISQTQLVSILKSSEECLHDIPELQILKTRLKKMRSILYKQ